MINLQSLTDKIAIGLSFFCALHCLAFPLAIILLPGLAASLFNSEMFHVWMIVAVFPTSLYALTIGCKKHTNYQLIGLGFVGLLCLVMALVLGEAFESEILEKTLTMIGAAVL